MPVFQKNNEKILFIHIPKAGSTSIEHFFLDNDWKMSFFDGGGQYSVNNFSLCSPQHMHLEMLRSLFRFSSFDKIFTFVRHPRNRILSEYKWRVKYLNERRNFNDWFYESFKEYEKNNYCLDNHLRPQVDFVSNAVEVFKIEDGIDKGLEQVLSKKDVDLSRLTNAMNSNKNIIELSDEVEKKIKEFYAEDFAKFNYE